jgi:hypothetical protein
VQRRFVNGGAPFDPSTPDSVEANLDVQQELGSAPGAQVVVYDIPTLSDADIIAGYQAVVDDNRADIVNSSFGSCELYYTKDYNGGQDFTFYLTRLYHDVFLQGNAQGITFVASSGDFGAFGCLSLTGPNDIGPPAIKGVSPPAIDPNVTAVGGTNLQTTFIPGGLNSAYVSENAFQDPIDPASGFPYDRWGSGGGVSIIFEKPPYQYLVNTRSDRRTNPDISMHMGGCPSIAVHPCDPGRSFDYEVLSGRLVGVIGTSASSPAFVSGTSTITSTRSPRPPGAPRSTTTSPASTAIRRRRATTLSSVTAPQKQRSSRKIRRGRSQANHKRQATRDVRGPRWNRGPLLHPRAMPSAFNRTRLGRMPSNSP